VRESAPVQDRRRDAFENLDDGAYLLSHSLGPLPRAVRASLSAFADRWAGQTSEDAWMAEWWALSTRVGDRFADLIGGARGSALPMPSATHAMATITSCFEYGGRNKIVTTALDFPSMGYVWGAQERLGAQVFVTPSDDGISTPLERILEAIDERTLLVALAHTSYRSSHRVRAEAIVRRAHEVGAMALLDVYQSAGVVEIDAAGLGADFLIGGSIKWLCGGPSCGFLSVRPDLIRTLEPRLTGWIGHENPFEFSHDRMRYADGIRRFAQGTPSIPALYTALPGLEMLCDIGVASIARESAQRTQRVIDIALERGWPVRSPLAADDRGGTVMLGFEDPERFAAALRERGVFVDWRPGVGIRLSPHFFNTDEELERAVETIEELADK